MHEDDLSDLKPIARRLRQACTALDLGLVDPLLRSVVEITNRSNWLQTEFSCSGLPEDHLNDSEGQPRRWGSYTPGEMYIAYAFPWQQMNRVLETAICEAARYKLALTIRFSSWSDELQAASTAERLARFAVAVSYEPAHWRQVEQALSVFGAIAALGVEQRSDGNRRIATQAAM
jgi:hypothetical protein